MNAFVRFTFIVISRTSHAVEQWTYRPTDRWCMFGENKETELGRRPNVYGFLLKPRRDEPLNILKKKKKKLQCIKHKIYSTYAWIRIHTFGCNDRTAIGSTGIANDYVNAMRIASKSNNNNNNQYTNIACIVILCATYVLSRTSVGLLSKRKRVGFLFFIERNYIITVQSEKKQS
jgi:hypothetical protein